MDNRTRSSAGFDANAQGLLTPPQRERLSRLTLPTTVAEYTLLHQIEWLNSWLRLQIALLAACILIVPLSVNQPAPVRELGIFAVGGALTISGIITVFLLQRLYYQRQLKQIQDRRTQSARRLQASLGAPADRIQHIEGYLTIDHGIGYRRARAIIADESFEVDDDLLAQLRQVSEYVEAYYYPTEDHGPVLLSFQTLDSYTIYGLDEAMGVSDDGEITYRQDLEDDIPDGEVRHLKRSDSDTAH